MEDPPALPAPPDFEPDDVEDGIVKVALDDIPWNLADKTEDTSFGEYTVPAWITQPLGNTVESEYVARTMESTLSSLAGFVGVIDGEACGGVGGVGSSILNATQASNI